MLRLTDKWALCLLLSMGDVILIGAYGVSVERYQVSPEEYLAHQAYCGQEGAICEPTPFFHKYYLAFRYIGLSLHNAANPEAPIDMVIPNYYASMRT